MKLRRYAVTAMVVVMLGTLLGGTAFAKTKITLWTFSGGTEAYMKAHEALMPEFQKEFPDVELEISYIPSTKEKYLVAYAAGTAPDIVSMRTADQASVIDAGMVTPVMPSAFGVKTKAELERLLLPGTVQTLNYRDGNMYFMATEISVFGLFSNNDVLAQSGIAAVPKTWEEMLALGKKLNKVDGDGKYAQIGLYIPRGWIYPSFTFATLMQGYGVDPISADGKPQFADPNAIKGVSIYPDLWRQLSDPVGAVGGHWDQGKAAMYWGANYQISSFKDKKYVFNWSSSPMPKFANGQPSTVSYALGHFVSAQSKNQELAWKIVAFFTGPKTAEKWYTDVALWHPWRGAWLDRIFKVEPLHAPFLTALEYSKPEISHVKVGDIRSKMVSAETRIYKGEQSVETSMQQLDTELRAVMGVK